MRFFIVVLIFSILSTSLAAREKRSNTHIVTKENISDWEFYKNLSYPQIKSKQHNIIVDYQRKTGKHLIDQGYEVQTTRHGEVLIIIIPANILFPANEVILTNSADKHLSPIVKLLSINSGYKVLLSMHSDDTGNEIYANNLTTQRVLSVYNWFIGYGCINMIVPYAMGADEPLMPNNSIANRQINRRLEIYLVPDDPMIVQAKENRLWD